ncbi:IS30 family transposase [Bythopirellula goksoeyrii]|uniref:Integrase core domain protein n=1 Tax=Bythopirellula goksoeyrii TaxID=1400387 RepID=A0A5B9QNB8_9BACT|nr:IS30 family transposase [Bythopirellula goksoeyrii]QEG35493.1 Integrase core domain protein [Bythopirellula goksoeyrii]
MAKHLTFEDRKILYRLQQKGKSNSEIAELMGRHRSTIGRKLTRNTGQRGYRPQQAQRLADERRLASRRPHKMKNPEVHQYVQDKLEKYWSPDQIAGRARCDFPRTSWRWLSRQTIYDWINDYRPEWQAWLRRSGRPIERRGKLTDCVRIDGRPEVINKRRRYGDWEGDTVVGYGRRSALVTMVERESGYLRTGRVDSMKSASTMRVANRRMKDLPKGLRRSMTFDNGKEFAEHQRLTRSTGMEVYFTDPYASWQKGTNENTNGLLRQFFPKGTDFTQVSHHEVAHVEQLINERPRRRLGYRTPAEVLEKHLCCI